MGKGSRVFLRSKTRFWFALEMTQYGAVGVPQKGERSQEMGAVGPSWM